MNNVCSSVYVSALFFVLRTGLTFSQVSKKSVVVLRSETVEEKKVIEVRVQSEAFKKRSDFRKRYFSSRGDHASETLTKRRSQIISVKKNRDILLSSYNH